jgi:hypothetical protein
MTVTVTPGAWQTDPLAVDPSARVMHLTVTGAAPGRWEVGNGGAHGYYLHVRHNGMHVGMANWNHWDGVTAIIAHESGPYTVTVQSEASVVATPGLTLTQAKIAAVRAEKTPGTTATVTNPDGNEVTWPRRDMSAED